MYPDRLYDLAFAYRKTKLWKKIYDTELFAVALPNGNTGYCSVMGMLGEHLSLALYVGNDGLDSYRRILDLYREQPGPLKMQEFLISQNCLQCVFEGKDELSPEELDEIRTYTAAHGIRPRGANAFPSFVCYRPAQLPDDISRPEDIEMICIALEAALAVSKKLEDTDKFQLGFTEESDQDREIPLLTPSGDGFSWGAHTLPPKQPQKFPEPALTDELLLSRLRKTKKRSGVWIADLVMVFAPLYENEENLSFPYTLLFVNTETEMAQSAGVSENFPQDAETLLRNFGQQMLQDGLPSEIQAADERTRCLLKNFAAALNIFLTDLDDPDLSASLEMDFLNHMGGPFSFDDGDDDDDPYPGGAIPLSEDDLLALPDELWDQLFNMALQGEVDDDTAEFLRRLDEKRHS